MGKNLIIKGADFSANAVAHEVQEPTTYIQTAGYGPSGIAGYQEGDVYYRCSGSSGIIADVSQNGFFQKSGSSATLLTEIGGQFAKLGDSYYQIDDTDTRSFRPYYGVTEMSFEDISSRGYIYVDENTAPTEKTDVADIHSSQIPLTLGKHYQFYGKGGSSVNLLIIKKADNTYQCITSQKSSTRFFVDYVPESAGEVAYFTWVRQSVNEIRWVGVVE